MRKEGIFSKMLITYTIIICVSFVILATILSIWFESYYFDQRKVLLTNEVQYLASSGVDYLEGNISLKRTNETLKYIGNYLRIDIWLVDNYGYVYATSNKKQNDLIGRQIIAKDLYKLRDMKDIDKKGTYSNIYKEPVHTFAVPINYRGYFKGAIFMNSPLSQLKEPLTKVNAIIWASAMVAVVGSCIVIYYFSQRIIIKPLAKINDVAEKISKGEVEKRVNINSDDEVGELAQSFNSMADSLEKVDKNRREFISNVSHELRSPITSIKGLIGGMIDGVIPPEKNEYYLNIAYEEIKRLTRLVNDLLDLSSIENGQFKLDLRILDINELIRLTVIKFETDINRKGLNVDVLLEEGKLYCEIDRDRFVQIVTNIIDNAVKYSNNNGSIEIRTKSKGDKILVSVFNTGEIIKDEDLKLIWERFYKTDKSRSSKISTGLGLPIVRSILTQFGEDIWVENIRDKGVKFTFTLQRLIN